VNPLTFQTALVLNTSSKTDSQQEVAGAGAG
jgi:hypothetical protein